MNKEAYYFPHFSNARHDRKIRRLRKELGAEGYGIYFMLLETLREQQDLRYPLEDLDLLAEEFGVSEAKIQVAVSKYELFEIDESQMFFSPKMIVYLEPYFKMREQRRDAGLKSAAKRQLNGSSTVVEQKKVNESKGKESKVKEELVLTARDVLFEKWFKYKGEKKQTYTPMGKEALIKIWSSYSDAQLEQIIDASISNNYAGLFAPKNSLPAQVTNAQPQTPRTTISIPDNY